MSTVWSKVNNSASPRKPWATCITFIHVHNVRSIKLFFLQSFKMYSCKTVITYMLHITEITLQYISLCVCVCVRVIFHDLIDDQQVSPNRNILPEAPPPQRHTTRFTSSRQWRLSECPTSFIAYQTNSSVSRSRLPLCHSVTRPLTRPHAVPTNQRGGAAAAPLLDH